MKMEKMLELKRDLAKGNEIIVRFGNDLQKCKTDLQTYQQELTKSREKDRLRMNFYVVYVDENQRSNSNETRTFTSRERT
jgi:uncharacterized radical SAM superfamily protein